MGFLGAVIGCLHSSGYGRLKAWFSRQTDRKLLIANNVFMLICSVYQAAVGAIILFLFNQNQSLQSEMSVKSSEERSTGVNNYLYQVVLGGYLTLIALVAIRAAHKVNIQVRRESSGRDCARPFFFFKNVGLFVRSELRARF